MPRPGGARQGTPGRSYSNRTDLNVVRASQSGLSTAAAGGRQPPPQAAPPAAVDGQAGQPPSPMIRPDMVPRLDDPTARPDEPVTAGLATGPGIGPAQMTPTPLPPEVATVQAAYAASPSPELRRTMMWLYSQGVL